MSAAYAYARPQQRQPLAQPRHIEIVTTRAQRRARPKSFYAVLAVSAVFALFLAQLMLSIVLSDGAYQISSLQSEQTQLSRTQQDLAEKLDLLASPQSLAQRAESLGMVVGSSSPAFLRLADGAVVGTPTAATGSEGALGASGGLVANSLLVSASTPQTVTDPENTQTPPQPTGASSQNASGSSVASTNGELPSPTTR
jgi:hypothetical protein